MGKVIKLQNQSLIYQTSFHDGIIYASFDELEKKLGMEAQYEGDCKVNYELDCEVDGIPFTIYDWKEGDIDKSTKLHLHIGTQTKGQTEKVMAILEKDYRITTFKKSSPVHF